MASRFPKIEKPTAKEQAKSRALLEKYDKADLSEADQDRINKQQYEMQSALNSLLTMRALGVTEPKTDSELSDRIVDFFKVCVETNTMPTIEKMSISLGISKAKLKKYKEGIEQLSPYTRDIVQKAYDMVSAYDAELVLKGVINPVAYIFRAKNFYEMSDKTEVIHSEENKANAKQTIEVINAKYKEIPEE